MNESFPDINKNNEEEKGKGNRRDFLKNLGLATIGIGTILADRRYNEPNVPSPKNKDPEVIKTPEIEILRPEAITISKIEKTTFSKEYFEERFVVKFQIKDRESISAIFSFGEKLEKNNIEDGRKFYEFLHKAKPEEIGFTVKENMVNKVYVNGKIVYEN